MKIGNKMNLRNIKIYSKKELRTYIKLPAREVPFENLQKLVKLRVCIIIQ